MDRDRHSAVATQIKELAATFIANESNTSPLITVMHVTIANDFRKATVYVTTIPDDREEDALIFLKRHASDFRDYLKKKGRLKYLPHIDFEIDRGERHRQNIDRISSELNASQNSSETDEV